MASNLTITISKRGAAIALSAAIFGAGIALLVDEVFFDKYSQNSYATVSRDKQSNNSAELNNATKPNSETQVESKDDISPMRITPSDALRIAEEATGGTAVDVYPGFEAGRDVFYVDVRSGLLFREVYVDAVTGAVIKIERGL